MKAGLAKVDITPRAGVQLAGFGPYENRHSIAIRDRLWVRAMAVSHGEKTLVMISCDLVGLNSSTIDKARELIREKEGLDNNAVMICCTHTHSGPGTGGSTAWGVSDEPYLELLPYRIARACGAALNDMREAALGYAEVPCEGIGLNRVYDKDAPPLDEVLRDDWRPAKPELTDTTCRVITVKTGGRLKGFISSFGCHPVVCCARTRYIHGDFAGVATNALERENPGSVGLFLQGASGDVNSCVVHKPEQESLLALDIIAARFSNCVREAIKITQPISVDSIKCIAGKFSFSRKNIPLEALEKELSEKEKIFEKDNITDSDIELRNEVVYIKALRKFIYKVVSGKEEELKPAAELQLLKIGPLTFFGAPFEVFQEIKKDLVSKSASEIPILISHVNGSMGYAPSNDRIGTGDYADAKVPVIKQVLPLSDIHNELVSGFLALEKEILSEHV